MPSVLLLGFLALRAFAGQPIATLQWLIGAGIGPLNIGICKAAIRLLASGDRFAEIRGNRVRLGPIGNSFRPALLAWCKIEPDNNFPEVYRLLFCFRLSRFTGALLWDMMVEDPIEAEDFRREVMKQSA